MSLLALRSIDGWKMMGELSSKNIKPTPGKIHGCRREAIWGSPARVAPIRLYRKKTINESRHWIACIEGHHASEKKKNRYLPPLE
jgi:hypothetical protein